MTDSLCFSCPLPDCDDTSPRCPLWEAKRRYARSVKAKRPIADADREGRNEWFNVWRQERDAKRSESELA